MRRGNARRVSGYDEEEVTESTQPYISTKKDYDDVWAEISVSEQDDGDYSVESHSDYTINSTGSAFYLPVDESNANELLQLADRKQIELVIARRRMMDKEDNRGYHKIAPCADLSVSLYEAVKKACAGTRIFVLGKALKKKLKDGDMIGYMRYGKGKDVHKLPFLTCKKISLNQAIDEVLPVTESVLPVIITYEQALNLADDEEELSD